MSPLQTRDQREDPDNYRPLLDSRPFFIETKSSTAALHGKQYSVERYCVGDVGGERRDRSGYYEAVKGVFEAYWEDPGSAADALETGEVPAVAVEMLRYMHPNVEWKTALTGTTYRGITAWSGASTKC